MTPRCGLLLAGLAVSTAALTQPYVNGKYDSSTSAEYWRARPFAVAARASELVQKSAGFGALLLSDLAANKLEERGSQRAADLVELLTRLGPTFIKAGQSASIRTDLLPPAYIEGLTALQDRVPPFSTDEARSIIREELGIDAAVAFSHLSDEPVAAASLGQVYRGTLADGTDVAVKVQRPDMMRIIALDMHLIRDYAAPLAKLFGVPGDLVGTADAWGEGFVAELDYRAEAENANRFNADLQRSALAGRVFAPPVIDSASSGRVLTTEWIDGERLDRSATPEDVPRLCSVAMNIYLEMMLDTGVLHCDPHPGNLLRTTDGKLCILDWGLVTSVRPDLQLTLIEHVAHLTAADYAKVPSDLIKLGFVPEGGEEAILSSGVVDFLTYTYSTWKSGGGASKLDVPKLFAEVRALAADSDGGIFQVPPYFAYIAKSFSVLEGIGLSVDPNYSIVDETLPYISKRIITDPSPRTAGALETFLFGDSKTDVEERVLNASRVATLLDGARRYAASTTVPSDSAPAAADAASSIPTLPPSSSDSSAALSVMPAAAASGAAGDGGETTLGMASADLEELTDTILDLLLAPEPSPLQEIAIEQSARLLGAIGRDRFAELRKASGTTPFGDSQRSRLGSLIDPLGLFRGSPLVEVDAKDREALSAAAKLADLASELLPARASPTDGATGGTPAADSPPPPLLSTVLTSDDLRRLAQLIAVKLWERREALQLVSRRFAATLLDQTLRRVSTQRRSSL